MSILRKICSITFQYVLLFIYYLSLSGLRYVEQDLFSTSESDWKDY